MNPESLGFPETTSFLPCLCRAPAALTAITVNSADEVGAQFLGVGAQSLWQDQRWLLWMAVSAQDGHTYTGSLVITQCRVGVRDRGWGGGKG